jgi:uncharacterized protein
MKKVHVSVEFVGDFTPALYAIDSLNKQNETAYPHHSRPRNPTRAALGFLTSRTAIDEGHAVTLFLAGDAVQLLRNNVLDNLTGLGSGKLREHYDAIVNKGAKFYLSGMSGKERGITADDLKDKPAELAMPDLLVRLSIESDKMFVY